MSKKYAFLLMGKDFNPQRDHACFSAGGVDSYIITVRSPEEAVKKARELADEGFGALEVCGAFGENLAREMYQAADRYALRIRRKPAFSFGARGKHEEGGFARKGQNAFLKKDA